MQEEERKGVQKEECGRRRTGGGEERIEEDGGKNGRGKEEGRKGGGVEEGWRRMGTGLEAKYHGKRKEVGGRAQFRAHSAQ